MDLPSCEHLDILDITNDLRNFLKNVKRHILEGCIYCEKKPIKMLSDEHNELYRKCLDKAKQESDPEKKRLLELVNEKCRTGGFILGCISEFYFHNGYDRKDRYKGCLLLDAKYYIENSKNYSEKDCKSK